MKKLLLALFITSTFSSFAQGPIIQGTYLPVRGTSVKEVWDITPGHISVPLAGQNQTWDYSTQFTNVIDTFQIKTFHPDNTSTFFPNKPYNNYFPSATHASYLRTPFNDASDSLFSYYIIDTAGVHNLGGFNIKHAFDSLALITSPNPNKIGELLLPSTCTYNMVIHDTSNYLAYADKYPVPTIGERQAKINLTKYKEMKGFGYGTLKLPNGVYNNVLLAKVSVKTIYNVAANLFNTGYIPIALLTDTVYFTEYEFVCNNTFGSSYLMHLTADTAATTANFGWYAVPVDFGSISGTVYDSLNEANVVSKGRAFLYRENSNFAKNDILDTCSLVNGVYQFDSIPYGFYRIAIRADSTTYPTAFTTYFGDGTDWIAAPTVHTAGPISSGNNIHLQYQSDSTGGGFVSGQLLIDNSIKSNKPIPGVDVIIKKTPGGSALKEQKTDMNGDFSLDSLTDGTYYLFVDIPGVKMADSCLFTISGGTLVTAMNFTSGTDSIHPNCAYTTVSIKENSKNKNLMTVYPNPYSSATTIKLNLAEKSDLLLEVYNILGEKIQVLDNGQKQAGIYSYNFSAKNLNYSPGIYLVKLVTGNKTSVIKIIEQ